MQLNLDYSLCEGYKSNTQKMRVVTEKLSCTEIGGSSAI